MIHIYIDVLRKWMSPVTVGHENNQLTAMVVWEQPVLMRKWASTFKQNLHVIY